MASRIRADIAKYNEIKQQDYKLFDSEQNKLCKQIIKTINTGAFIKEEKSKDNKEIKYTVFKCQDEENDKGIRILSLLDGQYKEYEFPNIIEKLTELNTIPNSRIQYENFTMFIEVYLFVRL